MNNCFMLHFSQMAASLGKKNKSFFQADVEK